MTESNLGQLDLVVKNARLFDGASMREGTYSVGIRRDKIEVLEARGSEMTGKMEIDGTGRFLMPGLIDCHIHLFDFLNLKSQEALDTFIEGPLHEHLRNFLEAGVTTVKSVGDSEDDILMVR